MSNNLSKIFKLGTIVFLAACLGVVIYTSFANQKLQKPVNAKVVISCPYSDKSFCLTENTIKKYVLAGNFSNILENQDRTNVACSSSNAGQSYCSGASANESAEPYAVSRNGTLQYMNRNDYINFFREYAAAHGPLSFSDEEADDGGVVMNFNGKNGAISYSLMFKKADNSWYLLYPVVRQ